MVRRLHPTTSRRGAETSTPVARDREQGTSRDTLLEVDGECTCGAAGSTSGTIHHNDCAQFTRIELNRMKPPEFPNPDLKLRRPEGLWTNANTSEDIDCTSPEDQMEKVAEHIERYLSTGEIASALYWMDLDYARKKEGGESLYIPMAEYIQNLCRVHAWDRIITFVEDRYLHQIHLLFAYYYITALYNLKLYSTILNAQIGHLVDLEPRDLNFENESPIPLRVPSMPPYLLRNDIHRPSEEEKVYLDDKTKDLKLLSAFLCLLAKTFIATENRTAALRFIWTAWMRDKSNIEAEELISRYNFPDGKRRQQQWEKFVGRRTYFAPSTDPRGLLAQAQQHFGSNNIRAAYEYTKIIMKDYGVYKPALLLHINCAVATKDADTLFLLAHQLVDRSPVDEISWYAVAMYYFIIGNNAAAKNFMNKATMMNRAFGEAWVAFGHVLSAENEHEQAMNCYLKAHRLLDRHHDLHVFLAMEYCRSNNIKWAMDFLKDPQLYPATAEGARANPYREHERGCVHFTQKQFSPAMSCFTRALRSVNGDAIEKNGKYVRDQIMQIDRFWEPLVANMAHTHRRMGDFAKAILMYECALVLFPNRAQTLLGLGICFACRGDVTRATAQLHRALSVNPFNSNARQALDRLVQKSADLFLAPVSPSNYTLDAVLNEGPVKSAQSARASPHALTMTLRSARKNMTSSVKRGAQGGAVISEGTPSTSARLPVLDLSPIPADNAGSAAEAMDTTA